MLFRSDEQFLGAIRPSRRIEETDQSRKSSLEITLSEGALIDA